MTSDTRLADKIRLMLGMQDEMNCHVDHDWRERNRAWYRAVWIECAELMDHVGGWKWWKHAEPDIEQAVLEIVDIWHFGMSLRLVQHDDLNALAEAIAAEWQAPPEPLPLLEEVERLAQTALARGEFAVGSTANMLAAFDCGFDDLFRHYVAKNVLNVFRQDNGYREGTYVKIWGGREDNQVLSELMRDLDSDAANFRESVYAALAARYAAVSKAG